MTSLKPVLLYLALSVGVVSAGTVANVRANGRFPGSTNLHASGDTILLSTTFGLLLSKDNGQNFDWVCEEAIGYGGEYDPDYAIHPTTHDIWATTFEGLRVSKDSGCTWNAIGAPLDDIWIGEVEIGSDGKIWAATSDGSKPNDVFTSTNGTTFTSAGLPSATIWWESVKVAPSDAQRAYVSGYQVAPTAEAMLRKTVNGGQSWTDLPLTGLSFGNEKRSSIIGVSPSNPDLVFLRIINAKSPIGDALYRSENAGQSWTKVLEFDSTITGFVIMDDGVTVLVGSNQICPGDPVDVLKGCTFRSTDGGKNFEPAPAQPKAGVTPTPATSNCFVQTSDGNLMACGANWEPDLFSVGRSTNQGTSWQKIIRFTDIRGPLENCPEGSPDAGPDVGQQAECARLRWPAVCEQIGKCTPSRGDAGVAPMVDAGTAPKPSDDKKCGCASSAEPGNLVLLGFVMLLVLGRRRTVA